MVTLIDTSAAEIRTFLSGRWSWVACIMMQFHTLCDLSMNIWQGNILFITYGFDHVIFYTQQHRWLVVAMKGRWIHWMSNIRRILVSNKVVDHSDAVGASPVGAIPTTPSLSTSHLASMDWAKTTVRRKEKYKFWDLVQLILEVCWYFTGYEISSLGNNLNVECRAKECIFVLNPLYRPHSLLLRFQV